MIKYPEEVRADHIERQLKAVTPNHMIKSAVRKLWLRSRERAAALKRDEYKCQHCGAKQSKAKGREVAVEVHHLDGVESWDEIYRVIREHVLCHPDRMQTLCKSCHKLESK